MLKNLSLSCGDTKTTSNQAALKEQYDTFVKESKLNGARTIIGVMPCCGKEMLFLTPEYCEASFESSMFCVHCFENVFKKISFHKAHITKIMPR